MGAMIIVGLIIAWMLLSTMIIIGVAMATSQGSRRELHTKPSVESKDSLERPHLKIGRKRGRITRPRPQWADGPPRSMKPFQN